MRVPQSPVLVIVGRRVVLIGSWLWGHFPIFFLSWKKKRILKMRRFVEKLAARAFVLRDAQFNSKI